MSENISKKITINLPIGPVRLPVSFFPDERGDRFMTRITKGFLTYFYPNYDYTHDEFHIFTVGPLHNKTAILTDLIQKLNHDERGNGVVDFWHRMVDEGKGAAWVFCFYRSAFIVVIHNNKDAIRTLEL